MATAERQSPRSTKWTVRDKDGQIVARGRMEAEAKAIAEELSREEDGEAKE